MSVPTPARWLRTQGRPWQPHVQDICGQAAAPGACACPAQVADGEGPPRGSLTLSDNFSRRGDTVVVNGSLVRSLASSAFSVAIFT